ncbi:hypothetical protein [Leptospira sp. GIMC2001]|uniref:hypothetical protein n=1 Tax=Leptospira sp. GIMC2001 TaxID=1513297 RepID=UPI00234A4EA3|nr:hypothetical protein [Leptospira sp. GIMC2001]WCL49109.1 hypothetical protein O4O04_17735 [Leptospira sp. GIMC2001]
MKTIIRGNMMKSLVTTVSKIARISILSILLLNMGIFADEENYVANFTLEKDAIFQGTTFKSGTEIFLSDEGQIAKVILGSDQAITDKTFIKTFPHIWKKGTVFYYASLFKERQMPEIPKKIILMSEHKIFGHTIPASCELTTANMIMTMGNQKEYTVSEIQVNCPVAYKIKGKQIDPGVTINIHSKEKVTKYNDKYEQVDI